MGGSASKECSEAMCVSVLKKNEGGELEEHYIPASKLEQDGDIKAEIEEIVANSKKKVNEFLASSQARVDKTMSTIEGVSVNNLSIMNLSEFSVIPLEFRELYLEVAQILFPFFGREVENAIRIICDDDVEGCLLNLISTSTKVNIIDSINLAIATYDSNFTPELKKFIISEIKELLPSKKSNIDSISHWDINTQKEGKKTLSQIVKTQAELVQTEAGNAETFTSKMGKDIKYDKLILCILLAYLLLKILK